MVDRIHQRFLDRQTDSKNFVVTDAEQSRNLFLQIATNRLQKRSVIVNEESSFRVLENALEPLSRLACRNGIENALNIGDQLFLERSLRDVSSCAVVESASSIVFAPMSRHHDDG